MWQLRKVDLVCNKASEAQVRQALWHPQETPPSCAHSRATLSTLWSPEASAPRPVVSSALWSARCWRHRRPHRRLRLWGYYLHVSMTPGRLDTAKLRSNTGDNSTTYNEYNNFDNYDNYDKHRSDDNYN